MRWELDRITWDTLIIDSPDASDYHHWMVESTLEGGPNPAIDYYKLHFFHVRNAADVLNGAVPDLQEKGQAMSTVAILYSLIRQGWVWLVTRGLGLTRTYVLAVCGNR